MNVMKKSEEEKIFEEVTPEVTNNWLTTKLNKGAVVLGLLPGSIAEQAGIKKGDCIVAVDNQAVQTLADFVEIIGHRSDDVSIDLIRGNEFKTIVLNYKLD